MKPHLFDGAYNARDNHSSTVDLKKGHVRNYTDDLGIFQFRMAKLRNTK